MRDPAQVKQDLVNQWIESAQQDLHLAELALAADYEGYAQIGFHAQQAIEKLVKALLVAHSIHPPRDHPIGNLRAVLRSVDPGTAEALKFADPLTPYAVRYRYPPRRAPLTRERAESAVQLAQKARDLLLGRITAQLAGDDGSAAPGEQP
jgi:HEPN domain-containing protein